MIFTKGEIDGAYVMQLDKRADERGFFARLWCEQELRDRGLSARIAQINAGFSPRAGTLRGLHYQLAPHAEVKIVRCARGAVYDVIVDLRPASPTYRRWIGSELTADDAGLLYVPEGCAHGYLTLVDNAELIYLTSQPYVPHAARGVRYDDPAFGFQWPEKVRIISEADRSWPDFV
ncbi:MAG: dTDP-4-dehydrorhamnose 3,5-epimerase family protein [Gammaproteobacteria bacterium]|nr:dTDP-4-dehydrorhamnose 3,5-epimerase family protein [Gammaproteobacteria bacterium]